MFQNSWSINLAESPRLLTIASLPNPSFVYQGQSNQLCVYADGKTQSLPIRKQILCLATINEQQVLLLTRYSLICLDILNNEQKFVLQFEDAQKMQVINNHIYVISRSSLYCYNCNGEEEYVNHVGANITAIAKFDGNGDEMAIATSELGLFKYNKLNIVFEYAKIIGKANALCCIGKGVMVGTEEGPIAYYETKKYKWKSKSAHQVLKIVKFQDVSKYNKNVEFLTNEAEKIIVARKGGLVQIRDWQNGGTISKVKVGQNLVDVFVSDFRKQGINQLVCGLESGQMKSFNINSSAETKQVEYKNATADQALLKNNQVQDLNKQKQELLFKISQLKIALDQKGGDNQNSDGSGPILNSNFKLTAFLEYREGLVLTLTAQNGHISGLVFEEPIQPIFVQKVQTLSYKFLNSNQSAGQIICEVLVHSSFSSTRFQVRKIPVVLAKFWKWGLDPKIHHEISGRLRFKMIERNARFIMWIKQCFFVNLSQQTEQNLENQPQMKFRFYNWYEKKQLQLSFSQKDGTVQISCDCLKTMGNIFQDLVNYVGLKNLNSELFFPQEKQKIKDLIGNVQKHSQTKVSMSTDLADQINIIKFLLVKSESARVVSSINNFRKTYSEIMQHNRNLVTEIQKKKVNIKALTDVLKQVNNFINLIANVRYGQAKNKVIQKCRQAIKNKKFPQIYNIMETGVDSPVA